jgi:hypothetical protein
MSTVESSCVSRRAYIRVPALIAAYNLSLDPLEQFTLAINSSWNKPFAYRLQDDGVWTLVDQTDNLVLKEKVVMHVRGPFATLQPLVLRLSNRAM